MIGRLQFQPLPQSRAQNRQRDALFARRADEAGDRLIQRKPGGECDLRPTGPHKYTAAPPVLDPAVPRQLPVARAHRVGMEMEPPRQFPRARQALAWSKVVAQNTQHDLRHQLFANANFASPCKPKLHGRPC